MRVKDVMHRGATFIDPGAPIAYLDDYREGDIVCLTVMSASSSSSSRDVRVRVRPG
jgi:hypothetical protein